MALERPPGGPPDTGEAASRGRTAGGAIGSFDALYAEHVAFVWRSLRRLGVPAEGLEDAAQNVFLVVHRRMSEFEGRASARTWLFRIVMRVASDARRAARRKGGLEALPDDVAADGAEGPHESAERREARDRLDRVLEGLDEDKRAVFVLAELEQMTAPEIADALGINVNTVGSRLRAARRAFEDAVARLHRRDR